MCRLEYNTLMKNEIYDVAVVGAGAAGLMAAVQAKRLGLSVLLLDGQKQIGAKILMSGGTRCNVTNKEVSEKDFASDELRIVRNILRAFAPEKTIQFFEELGVTLLMEEGGKLFPSTHLARTILDVFLKEIDRSGILLVAGCKVKEVSFDKGIFIIRGERFEEQAKTLVLSTGGLSYPGTGSDGSGYSIARNFGHSLVPTIPALTPLLLVDAEWKSLAGISVDARLTLFSGSKKQISFRNALLFTHFGLSGPCALDMSRHWQRANETGNALLVANFLPNEFSSALQEKIERGARKNPEQSLKRFLNEFLPERFVEIIISKSNIPESRNLNQLSKKEREVLIKNLFEYPFAVKNVFGYAKAEVTAGGVSLNEVDYKTLESKRRPGLFLAGEILDADGRIGGFNFQWAWATGTLAASGAAQCLSKR